MGKGGYGAIPHDTIDAIVAGSQLVNVLQSIVSGEVDPQKTTVVSVTSFQSGYAANIIPDSAHLMGTTRSFSPEVKNAFKDRLNRICQGIGETTRTTITLYYREGPPMTINDKVCVETGLKAGKKSLEKIDYWIILDRWEARTLPNIKFPMVFFF